MIRRSGLCLRFRLLAVAPIALACLGFSEQAKIAPAKSPAPSTSEQGMPVLQNYSARDYNSGPQVWTILQDRRGIMYFGNSSGDLLEFDGVTWRKIFTGSAVVRSLAQDASGRIWVGGSGRFGYLAPDASGTLQFASILDKVPVESRGFTDVWQTLATPQGVFFRSYEKLLRWDGNRMQVWNPVGKGRFQTIANIRGHILISQTGVGLQEIVGDELRNLPGGDAYQNSGKLSLHPYDDGRILISARDELLTLYDGHKEVPFPTHADDSLRVHKVYTTTLLPDGGICITTLDGGAVILAHDGKIKEIIDKTSGLLDSGTLSAYSDHEGTLWLGMGGGVARVEVNSPISIILRSGALNVIRFQGSIYVSSAAANAIARVVFDPKTGRPSSVPIHGPNQGWNMIDFKDPAGKSANQLLVATSEGVMKLQGDSLVPAMPAVHGLDEQTYAIFQSWKNPSRIFIGHSDGLGSMRWDGHTWIDEGRLPKTIYEARGLTEDADGVLWVGGGSGKVLRVEVAPTGIRTQSTRSFQKTRACRRARMTRNTRRVIFLSTIDRSKHLFRWDASTGKFVR